MSFFSRILAFILSVIISFFGISFETPSKRAENFRVVAYVVGDSFADKNTADYSHFEDITDVILIGVSDFDTEGNIILKANFRNAYDNLVEATKDTDTNLYLNIIGPGYTTSSSDWNEQMDSQGKQHDRGRDQGQAMLELIFSHVDCDFTQVYGFCFGDQKSPDLMLRMSLKYGGRSLATEWAKNKRLYDKTMSDLIEKLG